MADITIDGVVYKEEELSVYLKNVIMARQEIQQSRTRHTIEIEKIDGQINLLQQQHAALKRIDAQQAHTQIQTGSIFMCNEQWFYCSIAFGQLEFEQTSVFCLRTF